MPPVLPENLVLPERTLAGPGRIRELPAEGARFGTRGVLVFGAGLERAELLPGLLANTPAGLEVLPHRHGGGEPTLDQLADLLNACRSHRAQWVAGVGGGSVLDLAKAAAALYHARRPLTDYHDGAPLEDPALPVVAVPTTAGTGAEVTFNAVLTNAATGCKKSIRAEAMMPRTVILDYTLLATCPPAVVAASGMDALTQAIETFGSRKATWLSDQLALKALALIASALPAVYADARHPAAANLLLGSYLAGLALSHGRLGVVHGLAHPLGAHFHQPHGLVCAVILPHALEFNRPALGQRYGVMSTAVGGDLLEVVQRLIRELRIASPFTGRSLPDAEPVIQETLASGSTACNPRAVTRNDVVWFLARIFP